ncbi:MAG: bifunctional aldolase/short-chain dehydrogenase [Mariprofundaceae bacterium]
MESLWNDQEAELCNGDALKLRVYTSRLLGRRPDLVLHGGGNTSVKTRVADLFGDEQEVLFVKGSGWDLATIEEAGFAPVRLHALRRMAELEALSDSDMVRMQRAAMTDPSAPNPSVEAILHAIIPFTFVDHTHADAVVTITNTDDGENAIRAIFGERVLIVPYIMPGFVLARKVYELTREIDWSRLEGMVLLGHGVFSFADDARASYERMIKLVSEAENYLKQQGATPLASARSAKTDLIKLARIRKIVSAAKGEAMLACLDDGKTSAGFSNRGNVDAIATRGPLTPDHVIRTKRIPVIIGDDPVEDVETYASAYRAYFERYTDGSLTCLDTAPRWGVWPGCGVISFGRSMKEAGIIADISVHTLRAIQQAEALGGWMALSEKDIFDVEYWELEQAKLGKGGATPEFQGKAALVTGAASGIGRACAEALLRRGACVAAIDINPDVTELFTGSGRIGISCDVTDDARLAAAVDATVRRFGGLDIVISNAGIFTASERIADMRPASWDKSMAVNLTSHQRLLSACIPYLELGVEPAVVIIASKNVPAPGPGAAAYSVAKAGLTQLARVAALELAPKGVRINVMHPNQVFDTAIWTPEVLKTRAAHYGLSVKEYKTNNLLKTEVSSSDVANLACTMAGGTFAKITGAQVPIDGGNERVI